MQERLYLGDTSSVRRGRLVLKNKEIGAKTVWAIGTKEASVFNYATPLEWSLKGEQTHY